MKVETESTQSVRSASRACALAVSVFFFVVLGMMSPVAAQEDGNRAGLVVQFGDGRLHTTCVDLGPDGQATGEEVLRASGFDAVVDYGSGFGGGTVCKIDNEGCRFPSEKCFCECTMKPGDPCIYWSYFHLLDGQWRYANQGISGFIVKSGDVEAWAWGPAAIGTGVMVPLITFEQICGAAAQMTQTPTITQPSTSTAPPLSPGTLVSDTSPSPLQLEAGVTFTPAPSSRSSATLTLAPVSAATGTPTPGAIASGAGVEGSTLADDEQPFPIPAVKEVEGGEEMAGYVVFGVLVVVLVGGFIFFRIRQQP